MTTEELKTLPGFLKWADEGESKGFFRELGELIDEKIGNGGYPNATPVQANINLGIQEAVRMVRNLLKDPVGRRTPVQKSPPASYGVTDQPPE